jgi:hypothetical protein
MGIDELDELGRLRDEMTCSVNGAMIGRRSAAMRIKVVNPNTTLR